jgi:hypothetical protein
MLLIFRSESFFSAGTISNDTTLGSAGFPYRTLSIDDLKDLIDVAVTGPDIRDGYLD